MPWNSFRFVHAARLLLDHQLRGLGPVPDHCRNLVEDATLEAFDRIIDACLEHEVDFLLLVGDSFERSDQGLRGQAGLARGLARLDAQGIPAYVTSGRRDPWSAWLPSVRFSENVYRLEPNALPETFSRNDKPLVRLTAIDLEGLLGQAALSMGHTSRQRSDDVFQIGLVYSDHSDARTRQVAEISDLSAWLHSRADWGVDYWALGGSASKLLHALPAGVAHDPTSPQGIRPSETGVHGCTLWDVSVDGHMRSTMLPTGPVRFESRRVTLTPEMNEADLQDMLYCETRALAGTPTDRVWVLTWNFEGEGPLLERLNESAFRSQTLRDLRELETSVELALHHFNVPLHVAPGQIARSPFAGEFLKVLSERVQEADWLDHLRRRATREAGENDSAFVQRLTAERPEIETDRIIEAARRAGLKWLVQHEGVSQ